MRFATRTATDSSSRDQASIPTISTHWRFTSTANAKNLHQGVYAWPFNCRVALRIMLPTGSSINAAAFRSQFRGFASWKYESKYRSTSKPLRSHGFGMSTSPPTHRAIKDHPHDRSVDGHLQAADCCTRPLLATNRTWRRLRVGSSGSLQ